MNEGKESEYDAWVEWFQWMELFYVYIMCMCVFFKGNVVTCYGVMVCHVEVSRDCQKFQLDKVVWSGIYDMLRF